MKWEIGDVTSVCDRIADYLDNENNCDVDLDLLIKILVVHLSGTKVESSVASLKKIILKLGEVPPSSNAQFLLSHHNLWAALVDNLGSNQDKVVLPTKELLIALLKKANKATLQDVFLMACYHVSPKVPHEMEWCVSQAFKLHSLDRKSYKSLDEKGKKIREENSRRTTRVKATERKGMEDILKDETDAILWSNTIKDILKIKEDKINKGVGLNQMMDNICRDLESDNNKTKTSGLKELRCLAKEIIVPDKVVAILHSLIQNRRLGRESCMTLACLISNKNVKQITDEVLHKLFQSVLSNSSPAFVTLAIVLRHLKPPCLIALIQLYLMKSKSKSPAKRKLLDLLEQILKEWPEKELWTMMATLKIILRTGLVGNPEESLHFKKIFWFFEETFRSQAISLFVELDLCQGQFADGEDIKDQDVPHDGEDITEPDVAHDGEDITEPDVPHVEDLGKFQGAFEDITVIKGSGYSRVLKAKMGDKEVALRIIPLEERARALREIEVAKDTEHFHHLIVPLLFPAQLTNKSLMVMEFYPANLKVFLRSDPGKDPAKLDEVVHRLLRGVAILHSLDIIHSDLLAVDL